MLLHLPLHCTVMDSVTSLPSMTVHTCLDCDLYIFVTKVDYSIFCIRGYEFSATNQSTIPCAHIIQSQIHFNEIHTCSFPLASNILYSIN